MARIYVDKYTGTLERTDLYLVRLTMRDGTVIEDLEPRRLFPFSNTTMYITLLDKEEREVAFVRDLKELDEASVQALEDCFAEYYMIPKIEQLFDISEKFGSIKWKVKTDRGNVAFRIRNRQSDIKCLHGSTRVLIRDSNDNRYEIIDYTALDQHSRYLLFPYL
ncbi:MAG: DUF1854 domain-containing protein [Clostridia bacterium]|nr:DUF1854 domain-containing protein [Clostridia bacterium]MBQ7348304.1 DUF1854 domain-containing protein [Clostridia bacterium]